MGVMGTTRLAAQSGEYRAVHEFLVAEELLMPVITGIDFLSICQSEPDTTRKVIHVQCH